MQCASWPLQPAHPDVATSADDVVSFVKAKDAAAAAAQQEQAQDDEEQPQLSQEAVQVHAQPAPWLSPAQ